MRLKAVSNTQLPWLVGARVSLAQRPWPCLQAAAASPPSQHTLLASYMQAVDFSRKLSKTNGLPAFQPDDDTGDQLVLLSGPPNDMFLDVHNFNSAEVREGDRDRALLSF